VSGFGENTFRIALYIFIHVGVIKSVLNLVGQSLIGLIHAVVVMSVLIKVGDSVTVAVIVLANTSNNA
jgi:hypothetical protein